jgi:hypothetical protein
MAKQSKELLSWRKKQKRGGIMKPKTFDEIVAESEKKGLSADKARKVAGAAYWNAASAKYKKAKK